MDERATARARARDADAEDFWIDLLPEAAELVVLSGHVSRQMLIRKMRIGHGLADQLLDELTELEVIDGDEVLVDCDLLEEVLARIRAEAGADLADEPPPVVLTKQPPPGGPGDDDDWEDDDQPGAELAIRPGGDLVRQPRHPQTLVVRARQAAARQAVWVADQPVVSRTLVVGRQLPVAGARLAKGTPRGFIRTVRLTSDWVRDAQSANLLAKHSEAGEGESYARVAQARAQLGLAARGLMLAVPAAVLVLLGLAWWAPDVFAGVLAAGVFLAGVMVAPRHNPKDLLVGVALAGVAGAAAWFAGPHLARLVPQPPGWIWWTLGGIAMATFGWLGRHEDQPLVEMPARMAPHKTPPLTAPMVTAALCALGISKMREPDDITLLMDVARNGQGYQIDLELPPAVPTTDIIEKREELAAALRRELGTVWPAVGARHPGHLSLFVSDVAMVSATQAPWPLASGGVVSLFQPLPLFTDQRGQWVYQTLAYTAWVIGAVPRMGKTRALLDLGLAAALDVRARLYVFDLKGTGDLSALAKVAHAYRVGDEPEDIEDMLRIMRGIRQEMRHRTRLIRDLSLEENPDRGKVTDPLASRDPGAFGPIVVLVDEVQVWTQEFSEALPGQVFEGKPPKDPGKAVREEFIAILRDLVKRGPALGIIPMLATQKPDAKSIPSSIADNASARLCLKVNGQISNDQILGTSSYQAGIRATQFAFSDKGIAFFRGDGAEPLVVRTVDMDAERADEVALRARALRIAAGRLTGEAADDGIEDAVLVSDIVADVEEVMRARERGKAQHGELVEWLRELRPEEYEALDVEELSARLRGRHIKISQIRIGDTNRKGVWLSDLGKQVDEDGS